MNGMHSCGTHRAASDKGDGACLFLSPGQVLSLQLPGEDRGNRASVLGVKSGEFIIIKASPVLVSRLNSDTEHPVLIRLEDNGTIYGFEASVLSVLKHPLPLLFVAYPKTFEEHSLRRHPRIKCLVPTLIESPDFVSPGHICDMSMGGCRVVAPQDSVRGNSLEYGDHVNICLPLDGLRIEKLPCQVRAHKVDNGSVNLGLAFQEGNDTYAVAAHFLDRLHKLESLRFLLNQEAAREALATPPLPSDMRDLTPLVGDGFQVSLKAQESIELQFTGSHLYDQSYILGVDGTDTVIAEMPMSTGLKSLPKPGMGLQARFENHGSRYGFRTSVTKFITKPRPMVFFAYPKKIEILMRRRHPRVRCQLPISLENEHFKATGYISDISQGGCRVMANLDNGEMVCNVMTGDTLNMSMPLDGLRVGSLRAKVKSINYQENTITMGLVFAPDKKMAHSLEDFIAQLESVAN
ncbi:MAG: PilZ domain-containing protein [Desulfovibrio sp.]|nr:PilZ domain-containing protein [Desulfovibrio sp.]MBI4961180.1 PilZ domain-containing protein [Desulfovibrio sp.]